MPVIKRVLRSPAQNDPRSGLLQRSSGRLFQSLAVLGKMSIYVWQGLKCILLVPNLHDETKIMMEKHSNQINTP